MLGPNLCKSANATIRMPANVSTVYGLIEKPLHSSPVILSILVFFIP